MYLTMVRATEKAQLECEELYMRGGNDDEETSNVIEFPKLDERRP